MAYQRRLCVEHRERMAREKRAAYREADYWGRAVPGFGDRWARLLIVGLAPAAHGANRTGRMFTGDRSGDWLYRALHRAGFASQPNSVDCRDGLELRDAYITAGVRCAPPDNKPLGDEINTCNSFLANELSQLPENSVVLALGGIAHRAIVKALGMRQVEFKFGHAAVHDLEQFQLLDSYHCSRYNTNTRRLTPAMFEAVFAQARQLLDT